MDFAILNMLRIVSLADSEDFVFIADKTNNNKKKDDYFLISRVKPYREA